MQNKRNDFANIYWLEVIWVAVIGVFGRLIPHVPNVTPVTGLSLFAGANLPRRVSLLIIIFIMLLSDVCLALIFGYPIFSYYTLFTYSGFAIITLISSKLPYSKKAFPFYVLGATGGYWLWTNFGVWLTSGLYAKTFGGLIICYYMALPFLRNSLIGNLIWSYLIFGVFYVLLKKKIVNGGEQFKVCW